MDTLVIVIFVILVTIGVIGIVRGLDLKKWSSWLYAICPLLGGLLIGLLINNLLAGLLLGAMSAGLVLYGAVMTRWYRQRYEERAGPWLSQNQRNPAASLLASIMRKLMRK